MLPLSLCRTCVDALLRIVCEQRIPSELLPLLDEHIFWSDSLSGITVSGRENLLQALGSEGKKELQHWQLMECHAVAAGPSAMLVTAKGILTENDQPRPLTLTVVLHEGTVPSCHSLHLVQDPPAKSQESAELFPNCPIFEGLPGNGLLMTLQALTSKDYELVMAIDVQKNIACLYEHPQGEKPFVADSKPVDFTQYIQNYIQHCVLPEERSNLTEQWQLSNLVAQLNKKESLTFIVPVATLQSGLLNKQVHFLWMNREHQILLMARSDVTALLEEENRRAEMLSHALASAEQANVAKNDFLSRMSHEIRTPMNAILGMTSIALEDPENKGQLKDCLKTIDASSRFLLALINDILDMSRIESGEVSLKKERFLFQDLVGEIDALLDPSARKGGVAYQSILRGPIADAYMADVPHLKQILLNILSNAIKFTRAGGRVRLLIEALEGNAEQTQFRCTISDTGVGISKKFLPNIFKPFVQEYRGITSAYEGTGLGLAIAKNLITLMGGTINVDSFPGVGTVFTLEFALDLAQEKSDELPKTPSCGVCNLQGRHVLLVEDHRLNIAVAQKLLSRKGIQVDVAENGLLGVETFRNAPLFHYDAILMDIRMPVMDGLEATRIIRALDRPDAAAVPIIAMTANAFDEDREKSSLAGMNAHLSKPVEPQSLYAVLYEFISQHQHAETGHSSPSCSTKQGHA